MSSDPLGHLEIVYFLAEYERLALRAQSPIYAAFDAAAATSATELRTTALFGGIAELIWLLADNAAHRDLAAPWDDSNLLSVLLDWSDGIDVSFDLAAGAAGHLQCVCSHERAGLHILKDRLAANLHKLRSAATGVWLTKGRFVPLHRRDKFPNGYFDLGAAHGCAGVVAALSKVASQGSRHAEEALTSAVSFIEQYVDRESLPYFVDAATLTPEHDRTRLAWCYGSLGAAATLAFAGKTLDSARLIKVSRALGLKSMGRRGDSGAQDLGLCHGVAGIAACFRTLHEVTGEDVFFAEYSAWAETLLDALDNNFELGLMSYAPLSRSHVRDDSFLTGASGIALFLLSLVQPQFRSWEALLALR